MKPLLLLLFVLAQTGLLNGQTSIQGINLENGTYTVGFIHYTAIDSTRTYSIHNEFNNGVMFRPIPISIWYPCTIENKGSKQLTVLEYLEVLKEEEEWKNLPNGFLLDWFPYLWNTLENKAHLTEKTTAFYNAPFVDGKFPVIVYAPSYQASSIENFALFEYLASNGFVVVSSPSRGTMTRWLEGGTTKDMETQSQDVAFLLKEIYAHKNIDFDTIALMGFSFGGLSNAIAAMKNKNIKALVSLDGTERYAYNILEKSAYFDLSKLNVPYVHFAQKNIPEDVMEEDGIPKELNYTFQLYDSLQHSDVYSYKFHDLTHSYFSSFGVLFGNRDKRQDKGDDAIMASYKLLAEHVFSFLSATLKNDANAKEYIENTPYVNGVPENLVSKKMKKSPTKKFGYKDFNDLAAHQGYRDLVPLYKKTLAKYPGLELKEGMLNTLGLRLSFDPNRKEQGIQVLLLALHIYPESANLYDSLAEAYFYTNDIDNAIINFTKSLQLDPQNQNAIARLKQLGR